MRLRMMLLAGFGLVAADPAAGGPSGNAVADPAPPAAASAGQGAAPTAQRPWSALSSRWLGPTAADRSWRPSDSGPEGRRPASLDIDRRFSVDGLGELSFLGRYLNRGGSAGRR